MNNTNNAQINKLNVMKSSAFIPLTIPIFGLIYILIESFSNELSEGIVITYLGIVFYGLLWGVVIWLPTTIGCILTAYISINENTNKNRLILLFILEGILASIVIIYIFYSPALLFNAYVALIISIGITQFIRWWWLSKKSRMYLRFKDKTEEGTKVKLN